MRNSRTSERNFIQQRQQDSFPLHYCTLITATLEPRAPETTEISTIELLHILTCQCIPQCLVHLQRR